MRTSYVTKLQLMEFPKEVTVDVCVFLYVSNVHSVCVCVKCSVARWRDGLTVEFRDVGCTSLCKTHIVTAFCFQENCLVSVRKRKQAIKVGESLK